MEGWQRNLRWKEGSEEGCGPLSLQDQEVASACCSWPRMKYWKLQVFTQFKEEGVSYSQQQEAQWQWLSPAAQNPQGSFYNWCPICTADHSKWETLSWDPQFGIFHCSPGDSNVQPRLRVPSTNLNLHTNHQIVLLKCALWFSPSRWGLRACITNKLQGTPNGAGFIASNSMSQV